MSRFRGCWSCGSHAACWPECLCAKCLDGVEYQRWRHDHPARYQAWLDKQLLVGTQECDCPVCSLR
jgi:hypothetical protein